MSYEKVKPYTAEEIEALVEEGLPYPLAGDLVRVFVQSKRLRATLDRLRELEEWHDSEMKRTTRTISTCPTCGQDKPLKPCPFCGGPAEMDLTDMFAGCRKCDLFLDSREKWNNRA